MSFREFHALQTLYHGKLERWAIERAQFANAHFANDRVPFLPEDFLGGGNREQRKLQSAKSQLAAAKENLRLNRIKKGDPPPDNLPSWARRLAEAQK